MQAPIPMYALQIKGESLEYAVNVEFSDDYLATFRVARGMGSDSFEFYNDTILLDVITIPNTNGWVNWINVISVVYLEQGQQSIIIKNTGNPFNINWIDFEEVIETDGVVINNCPVDSLEVGTSYALTAEVSPANATNKNLSWTSSNELVATVDQAGFVKVVSPGNAEIAVTTENGGYSATCTVSAFTDHTSVKKIAQPHFTLYPNPFENGRLTLKGEALKNSLISLADINGRMVYHQSNDYSNSEVSVLIENLDPGLYFVNVINESTCLTEKLVIK